MRAEAGSAHDGGALLRGALWAGLPLILVGAAMLGWTWLAWPDVWVDFGRELYVPWRICAGQVLYRDIAYFNGPLSPYVNAVWFSLLGNSLHTLVIGNLVFLVLLVLLLDRLLLSCSDRLAATTAGVVFLLLFAFSQYTTIGNYNYLCPYSHELTHGLLLSLAALYALYRFQLQPRVAWALLVGLLLGLVLLTKPEMSAAVVPAAGAGLLLALWKSNATRPQVRRAVIALAAGVLIPPALSIVLLHRSQSLASACWGTLGAWRWVFSSELVSHPFYRGLRGTPHLLESLWAMFLCAGLAGLPFLAATLPALLKRKPARAVTAAMWVVVAAEGVVACALGQEFPWLKLLRPLPLVLGAMAAILVVQLVRSPAGSTEVQRTILRLVLTLFSLGLLAKIVLSAHVYHYGFVLAMPGTLLVMVALLAWLPRWSSTRGGSARACQVTALVVVGLVTFFHLQHMAGQLDQKRYWVGQGGDRLRADARGPLAADALALIRETVGANQTLAVLPQGVMLNYLSRRPNPTPFTSFLPVELAMFGEDRMVRAFDRNPPDYVLLLHSDTTAYGYRFFGTDYGQALKAWIDAHYEPVQLLGAMPLRDERGGALLLRYAAPATESSGQKRTVSSAACTTRPLSGR